MNKKILDMQDKRIKRYFSPLYMLAYCMIVGTSVGFSAYVHNIFLKVLAIGAVSPITYLFLQFANRIWDKISEENTHGNK